MAQPDAARAQAETLLDWARQWERDDVSGATEITFLLRRTARQIAAAINLDVQVDVADSAEPIGAVEDVRLG